ncbi:MAG: hypothetical protein JRJ59_04145 [Deltaproteobacteria bacterium]|nr:hypothetical protein [Deltaproteobacteria bacterium]
MLKLSRNSLLFFVCLTILSLSLAPAGGPAPVQAKMIKKAPGSHALDLDDLAQRATERAELERMSAGFPGNTMLWLGFLLGACVVMTIILLT